MTTIRANISDVHIPITACTHVVFVLRVSGEAQHQATTKAAAGQRMTTTLSHRTASPHTLSDLANTTCTFHFATFPFRSLQVLALAQRPKTKLPSVPVTAGLALTHQRRPSGPQLSVAVSGRAQPPSVSTSGVSGESPGHLEYFELNGSDIFWCRFLRGVGQE